MDNEQLLTMMDDVRRGIDAGNPLKPTVDEMYVLFAEALKDPSKNKHQVVAFCDKAIEFFQRLKEQC
jgi:hypothetical protein